MAGTNRGDRRGQANDAWARLLRELDRPLTPGFMTAGYAALGRYLYLAATHGDERRDGDG